MISPGIRLFAVIALSLRPAPRGRWRLPLNENGDSCPWPLEPLQLINVPVGMYHCPWCGGIQLAGVPHMDHADARTALDYLPEILGFEQYQYLTELEGEFDDSTTTRPGHGPVREDAGAAGVDARRRGEGPGRAGRPR